MARQKKLTPEQKRLLRWPPTETTWICPQILEEALAAGITTVIGGGTGPAEGTKATTVTPGSWHLARMLAAIDPWPVNVLLLGKGKPIYAPHVDCGDFVIVLNAEKVQLTGGKEEAKIYYRHTTQQPGSLKSPKAREVRAKHPTRLVENAVFGMLPKTKLGRKIRKKLKVYVGAAHPHQAQKPQALDLAGVKM